MNSNSFRLIFKFALTLPLKFLSVIAKFYLFILSLVLSNAHLYSIKKGGLLNEGGRIVDIEHENSSGNKIKLSFTCISALDEFRANTFSEKEPETLEWIDKHLNEGDFLDIGANVGLYSIYFAKQSSYKVMSFEPSVFNLQNLVKNICLNSVNEKVSVLPFPLFSENAHQFLCLESDVMGGANNYFGARPHQRSSTNSTPLLYPTLGFSLDNLWRDGLLSSVPALIKIDVDGIEHLILEGAKNLLSEDRCRSVLVEVDRTAKSQSAATQKILCAAGFVCEKRVSGDFSQASNFENQIWSKR